MKTKKMVDVIMNTNKKMPFGSIVDISCMIGPWPFHDLEFETAEQLLGKMDHFGIQTAYVYSSYAIKTSPLDGNYMLMDAIKGMEDRLKPCWVILPTWELESGKSLEEELRNNNVKMTRMFPNEQGYSLETWVCGDTFEMLQRNRIPLIINNPDVTWNQLHVICSQYPELPIILSQVEYQRGRMLYKVMEQHSNLYLDISTYYVYDGVEDIVARFGSKRMLFGSRMPFLEGGAALGMLLLADLADEQLSDVLFRNHDRLIKEVRI